MILYRNILIVVLFSISLTAFAQQKEVEQTEALYKKAAYEKCLKKAEKHATVYPNQYQFPLYAAVSHWQLYKSLSNPTDILGALEQLALAYRINGKKITKYPTEQKQIHKAALQIGPKLLKEGKKEDAKALYGYVATVFKDTTEEYTWLYPSPSGATTISVAGAGKLDTEKPKVTPVPSTSGSLIDNLLAYSRTFLGLPYKPAGCEPSTGFDCSGFVSYLFKQFDIHLPRSSQELSKVGSPVALKQTKPGDLLFYGYKKNGTYRTNHVALVFSHENGHLAFIHSSSHGVVIDDPNSLSWAYWEKRFLFARRVL